MLTIKDFIEKGILPGVDILNKEISEEKLALMPKEAAVITADLLEIAEKNNAVDLAQLDRLRVLFERGKKNGYIEYLKYFRQPGVRAAANNIIKKIKVSDYETGGTKYDVSDFVSHFTHRYKQLEKILRLRPELQGVTSINRVLKKNAKEQVSIIGMILDKSQTKNGNLMITLEDPTGKINVLVSKAKPELFNSARDIVHDEVIGIDGVCGSKIIFANNIFWPDIPYNNELKKAPDEIYAIFLSDVHVGSKFFLEEEFNKFLKWLNGNSGNKEQREIASKVGYVFIVGDLVDGIGIYPDQEKELTIKDIYQQYSEFVRLISQIPKHIDIILCPGNHDAERLSEPQPKFDIELAKSLYEMPNVTLVTNPSLVNIQSSENFEGLNVLLYHGYSFDYYVANVDSIRNSGGVKSNSGYHRADLIMKFLLKRRHLAPAHTSTLRIPDNKCDNLVISTVPDLFVTGHIHYSLAANYRGVTMISCSCWQSTTTFQQKLGHEPEPARVPIVNLKTRAVKNLRFT